MLASAVVDPAFFAVVDADLTPVADPGALAPVADAVVLGPVMELVRLACGFTVVLVVALIPVDARSLFN